MTTRHLVFASSGLLLAAATLYMVLSPATPSASQRVTLSSAGASRTAASTHSVAATSAASDTSTAAATRSVGTANASANLTGSQREADAAIHPARRASAAEVAKVLASAGAVPGTTSVGPVPPEGSGRYGAPDRLSARRIGNETPATTRAEDQVRSGDAVRVRYRMYELMSGQEVDSSPADGMLVRVGVMLDDASPDAANRLPRDVAETLSHARIGEVVEVILPKGTKDLPPELDPTAAYKLHLTVVARY